VAGTVEVPGRAAQVHRASIPTTVSVADSLEADWNAKLRELSEAQEEHEWRHEEDWEDVERRRASPHPRAGDRIPPALGPIRRPRVASRAAWSDFRSRTSPSKKDTVLTVRKKLPMRLRKAPLFPAQWYARYR